jgi:hypothetical protein
MSALLIIAEIEEEVEGVDIILMMLTSLKENDWKDCETAVKSGCGVGRIVSSKGASSARCSIDDRRLAKVCLRRLILFSGFRVVTHCRLVTHYSTQFLDIWKEKDDDVMM